MWHLEVSQVEDEIKSKGNQTGSGYYLIEHALSPAIANLSFPSS